MSSFLVDIVIASFGEPNTTDTDLELCLETVDAFTELPHRVLVERSHDSAAANRNRALARSDARYVCFLDDDAWVTPGWCKTLVETLETRPEFSAIGPKLKLETGRLFCFGMARKDNGDIFPLHYNSLDDSTLDEYCDPFAIPTTCLLLTRSAVTAAVGFDEHYRSCQWEDVDYYLRLKRAGIRGLVTSAATVYHRHRFRSDSATENAAHFRRQWASS